MGDAVVVASGFWTYAFEHFLSFGGGMIVGFVLSNRFKLVKRNGESST